MEPVDSEFLKTISSRGPLDVVKNLRTERLVDKFFEAIPLNFEDRNFARLEELW